MKYASDTMWQEQAACANSPEVDKQGLTNAAPTKAIAIDLNRRYCSGCPVRIECYDWAKADPYFSGIAGGAAFVGEKSSGKTRRIIPIRER